MLSITSTGNVILCLNEGLSFFYSVRLVCCGVTDTSEDFVNYE